jgi:hypothetical protein
MEFPWISLRVNMVVKVGCELMDSFFTFEYDDEKLFMQISKPTEEELDYLDCYELTSPHDYTVLTSNQCSRRNKKKLTYEDIPMVEWQRRLAMVPEDIIHRTFDCTTQYYLNTEFENRQHPRDHVKSRFPGLRCHRQKEAVASDTFFPSVVSNRGNTCSQFFATVDSDRWDVFPLKSENNNVSALQDYIRSVGAPTVVRTDNAQSELGLTWTTVLRDICIGSETTEPHHPWQNPAERKIGALGNMVRHIMRVFKAPLSRHDYAQKWCCDVHNILANRKLGAHHWSETLAIRQTYQSFVFIFGNQCGTMFLLNNLQTVYKRHVGWDLQILRVMSLHTLLNQRTRRDPESMSSYAQTLKHGGRILVWKLNTQMMIPYILNFSSLPLSCKTTIMSRNLM